MSNPLSSVDKATQAVLNEISKEHYENYSRLGWHKIEDVVKLCNNLKSLIEWNFDFEEFYSNLCTMGLPLEILWNFHVFQIMPFDTFLLKSNHFTHNFETNLTTFILKSYNGDWSLLFIQTGVLSYFVGKAFPVSDGKTVETEVKKICRSVVESFLHTVFSLKKEELSLDRMKPFLALWSCGTLEVDSLHSFCYFALQIFLTELKATETDAFIVQEKVKNIDEPFHLLVIIKKFLKILKYEELEAIMCQSLYSKDTNWKNFIVFIASIIETTEEEPSFIKKLETMLIKDGLDQLNPKSLQRALLIGRQTSLSSNLPFSTAYVLWFQKSIRDNIQIRNPQAVSLLIQVLSYMVPYETNIDCIKVFLEKPIMVPQECQSIHSDYIVLLKTRIKDLQPRVNTEKILERVLNTFQETEKIPPYILEASLMNKHHYLNEFLPALLKPRVMPSAPDIREKFIDLLNKSDKIPSCIFQKYKLSCQQEQQNLLAGINMGDDNFIEFMDEDIRIIN